MRTWKLLVVPAGTPAEPCCGASVGSVVVPVFIMIIVIIARAPTDVRKDRDAAPALYHAPGTGVGRRSERHAGKDLVGLRVRRWAGTANVRHVLVPRARTPVY